MISDIESLDWNAIRERLDSALLGRFAGYHIDYGVEPPSLRVHVVVGDVSDQGAIESILSTLKAGLSVTLDWELVPARYSLRDLMSVASSVDDWVATGDNRCDVITHYVDVENNCVVLLLPSLDESVLARIAGLVQGLPDGSVNVVEGGYEPLSTAEDS